MKDDAPEEGEDEPDPGQDDRERASLKPIAQGNPTDKKEERCVDVDPDPCRLTDLP
jgi:hypothetical protein